MSGIAPDDRSPHLRQRFIELRNVGPTDIPPFGVCEVLDSDRPETFDETPDGGRTVLLVSRPTQDEPCNVVVNGPCEIPVGEERRVGTKDSPMIALVYEEFTPGTSVGVKADSYYLHNRFCGFVVDGDYDGSNSTMRVTRYDNCPKPVIRVRAIECSYLGQSALAQPMRYDPVIDDWVDDLDRQQITVYDPLCWRIALVDEIYTAYRSECNDPNYQAYQPFGLTRRVKIKDEIDCGQKGTAYIMENPMAPQGENDTCGWSETLCQIEVCNAGKRKIACDAEEEATVTIMPGECLGWVMPDQRPLRASATLNASMCGGAANFDSVTYEDVCEWTPRQMPQEAANPLQLYGCEGDIVELTWNEATCAWEVLNVQVHVFDDVMINLRCGDGEDCTMEREVIKGSVALQQCQTCEEKEWKNTQVTGHEIDVITAISLNQTSGTGTDGCGAESGGLSYTKTRFCVPCSTDEDVSGGLVETEVTIPLVQVNVLRDVWQDGTDRHIYGDVCTIYALCLYDCSNELLISTTECDTGTGEET